MGVSASGVLCARVRRGIERPWRAPPRAHRGMHATADACTVEAWVGVWGWWWVVVWALGAEQLGMGRWRCVVVRVTVWV